MVHSGRFLSNWKKEKLVQMTTCCPSLPFVVTRCHFFITRSHSLSTVVIRCDSLSFVVIRCLSLYHSLSLVVTLVVIRFHSLSFVVTCCTTCCHSLSLDVSLVCLFVNDYFVIMFYVLKMELMALICFFLLGCFCGI